MRLLKFWTCLCLNYDKKRNERNERKKERNNVYVGKTSIKNDSFFL